MNQREKEIADCLTEIMIELQDPITALKFRSLLVFLSNENSDESKYLLDIVTSFKRLIDFSKSK